MNYSLKWAYTSPGMYLRENIEQAFKIKHYRLTNKAEK